jgi:hypothetical protein
MKGSPDCLSSIGICRARISRPSLAGSLNTQKHWPMHSHCSCASGFDCGPKTSLSGHPKLGIQGVQNQSVATWVEVRFLGKLRGSGIARCRNPKLLAKGILRKSISGGLQPRKSGSRNCCCLGAARQSATGADSFFKRMVALLMMGRAQKPTLRTNPNVT